MVAYSFKPRFVEAIRWGLGLGLDVPDGVPAPKRQTVRAHRRRHARPGEELQLYTGMRTRHCALIGRARCVDLQGIHLELHLRRPRIYVGGLPCPVLDFARRDGFVDWADMLGFWRDAHGPITEFEGVLITWEPLP